MIGCPPSGALEQSPLPPEIRAHVATCEDCQLVVELLAEVDDLDTNEDCPRVEGLIPGYAENTLSAADREFVEQHLLGCPQCRELLESSALPEIEPGNYRLGREIARGGMGRIVAAYDLRAGRDVAIKELFAKSRHLEVRFVREARVTARLQHPNIIPIYEIGRWPDKTPFYSMRRVDGRTLARAIHDAPGLAERLELLSPVIDTAEAIAFAHGQQVIHRDLTPSNVLVGLYGETVVIDWGLAKDLADERERDLDLEDPEPSGSGERLTSVGAVIGTAAYMPPEQAHGEPVDERADVYALGAILYHVLGGKAPYSGATTNAILREVRTGPPTPIEELVPGAPSDLVSIVRKAMSRQPEDRFPTARELAENLVLFRDGQMVRAHAYSRRERIARFFKRHRAVLSIASLAVVVIAVLGTIALSRILHERQAARNKVVDLLVEHARGELVAGHGMRGLAYLDAAQRAGDPQGDMFDYLAQAAEAGIVDAPEPIDCGGDPRWLEFRPPPVGRDVVVVCHDAAQIWSLDDRASRLQLPRIGGAYDAVAYSHDGSRFVTWGEEGKARLWNADTGAVIATYDHGAPITFVSFTGDDRRIATTGRDGTAKIWNTEERSEPRTIVVASGLLHDVYGVLDPHHDRLFTATFTGRAAGWDITTGEPIREYSAARGLVFGGDLSRDGSLATTCGTDGIAKVWDTATGALVVAVGGHTDMVWKCVFDPAGKHLLTTSQDGRANVWDIATGATVTTVVHGDIVFEARFSAHGRRFLTVGVDGRVRVWDAHSGALLETHATGGGKTAGFSPDGNYLVALRGDGRFQVWPRPDEPLLSTFSPPADADVAAVSRDGKVIAVDDATGSIAIYNTRTSRRIADHLGAPVAACESSIAAVTDAGIQFFGQAHPAIATEVPAWIALSPDCSHVAIGRGDGTFEVRGPDGAPRHLTGTHALLDNRGRVAIWANHARPRVDGVGVGDEGDLPIGFSGDGERIVLVSHRDRAVHDLRVWDVRGNDTGLRWPDVGITPALDPSGTYVAAIGADHAVAIANVITGETTAFLSENLQNVAVNARGTMLVAIGEHGTAAMVLSADGRVLSRWPIAHPGPIVSQTGVTPPHAYAWWSADRSAVSLSSNLTVRSAPRHVRPIADLMKAVPWRLVEGRLEPVMASLRGRVVRGTEPVPEARVTVELRKSGYVGPSTISHHTMETHTEPVPLDHGPDADGAFEVDDVYPGLYLVTASVGDTHWQCTVAVDPDGATVEIDLAGSCRSR